MMLSNLNLALTAVRRSGGGGGETIPNGPAVIERFATDYASGMNGATVTPYGGATWGAYRSASGVKTSPYVSGAGQLKFLGTAATYQRNASVIRPAATAANRRWVWYTDPTNFTDYGTAASGIANRFVMQLKELSADSSHQFIRVNYLGGVGQGGQFSATCTVTGAFDTPTITGTLAFTGDLNVNELNRGDTFAIFKRTSGSSVYLDLYKNGWKFATGQTDIKAVAKSDASGNVDMTYDDSFGVYGYGDTTAARLAEMRTADLDTEADLWLRHDTHIAQYAFWTATPTAAHVRLDIRYSGSAPNALTYTVYDVSAGALTPVTGHDNASLTHTDGGETNRLASLIIESPPSKFVVGVRRVVNVNGTEGYVEARTPVLHPGETMGMDGQSPISLFWQSSVSAPTITPPSNGWTVDGSTDSITNAEDRRTQRMSTTGTRPNADRAPARLGEIAASLFGHANIQFIRSGHGGRDQQERAPSTLGLADNFANTWDTFVEGVKRATDIGFFYVGAHTFEVNNAAGASGNSHWSSDWTNATQIAKWKSIVYAKVQILEALVGHPILVGLGPPMTIHGTTNKQRAHDFERMLRDIVATNGDGEFTTYGGVQRFYRCATLADLRHLSGDVYHIDGTVQGRSLQAFRVAHDWARARGVAGAGRIGADLVSAAKQSGTVIRLTFNANGATSAALRGDTSGNPSCSFEFNTATDFGAGTALTPTAVGTPSAVSGGQFTVDWTFASVPGGNVYVRAPRGQNPINPTNNATINLDMMSAAALTTDFGDTGVGTTVFNTPAEPYINLAGNDYVTAA